MSKYQRNRVLTTEQRVQEARNLVARFPNSREARDHLNRVVALREKEQEPKPLTKPLTSAQQAVAALADALDINPPKGRLLPPEYDDNDVSVGEKQRIENAARRLRIERKRRVLLSALPTLTPESLKEAMIATGLRSIAAVKTVSLPVGKRLEKLLADEFAALVAEFPNGYVERGGRRYTTKTGYERGPWSQAVDDVWTYFERQKEPPEPIDRVDYDCLLVNELWDFRMKECFNAADPMDFSQAQPYRTSASRGRETSWNKNSSLYAERNKERYPELEDILDRIQKSETEYPANAVYQRRLAAYKRAVEANSIAIANPPDITVTMQKLLFQVRAAVFSKSSEAIAETVAAIVRSVTKLHHSASSQLYIKGTVKLTGVLYEQLPTLAQCKASAEYVTAGELHGLSVLDASGFPKRWAENLNIIRVPSNRDAVALLAARAAGKTYKPQDPMKGIAAVRVASYLILGNPFCFFPQSEEEAHVLNLFSQMAEQIGVIK